MAATPKTPHLSPVTNPRLLLVIVAVALGAGGCTQILAGIFKGGASPPKETSLLPSSAKLLPYSNGLTAAERHAYYRQDEGIHYLPSALFRALSRPKQDREGEAKPGAFRELFFANPSRLGLPPYAFNSDGALVRATAEDLPIGITESTDDEFMPMAGINCATCHTAIVVHSDHAVVVDGAPSNFAIDRFVSQMLFSLLSATLNPAERETVFARFLKHAGTGERAGPNVDVSDIDGRNVWDSEAQAIQQFSGATLDSSVELTPTGAGGSPSGVADGGSAGHGGLGGRGGSGGHSSLPSTAQPDGEGYRDIGLGPAKVNGFELRLVVRQLEDLAARYEKSGVQCRPGRTTFITDSCVYPRLDDLTTKAGFHYYLVKRSLFFLRLSAYAGPADDGATKSGFKRSNPWYVTKNLFAHRVFGLPDPEAWLHSFRSAPIQTPYIWYANSYAWIFWSGVTNSLEERNLAQGIALLTDFNWKRGDVPPAYQLETTVSVRKLHALTHRWVRKIVAPRWPDKFPQPPEHSVQEGKRIFWQKCHGCHSPVTEHEGEPLQSGVEPGDTILRYCDVGTDGMYVAAQREEYFVRGSSGQPGGDFFQGTLGVFMAEVRRRAYERERVPQSEVDDVRFGRSPEEWHAPVGNFIVAKPLAGVWATGPFLHNGSVRTVRELLRPTQRMSKFWVGSQVLDIDALGFESTKSSLATLVRTTDTGSSNRGHEFGAELSATEVDQLIDFLTVYAPDEDFSTVAATFPRQTDDIVASRCVYRIPLGHPSRMTFGNGENAVAKRVEVFMSRGEGEVGVKLHASSLTELKNELAAHCADSIDLVSDIQGGAETRLIESTTVSELTQDQFVWLSRTESGEDRYLRSRSAKVGRECARQNGQTDPDG